MGDVNADQLTGKLDEMLPLIKEVSSQFTNPVSNIEFVLF